MVLRTKIVRQGCMEEQVWPLVKNVISTPKQLNGINVLLAFVHTVVRVTHLVSCIMTFNLGHA